MSSGRNSQRRLGAWVGAGVLLSATPAHAMHIADGVLPLSWAALWWLLALPFVALGLRELRTAHPTAARGRTLLGLTGAAVFVISCIPIPVPLAGTDSHLCGTGLAALFIGPGQTVVVASVVLVLQALFLAHGGLTTLGADIVSMGVAGAYVAVAVFWSGRRIGLPAAAAAFVAGVLSDWATYAVTSLQLASALHGDGAFVPTFAAMLAGFLPTQVPLGILEGFMVAGAYRYVRARKPELLRAQRGQDKEGLPTSSPERLPSSPCVHQDAEGPTPPPERQPPC